MIKQFYIQTVQFSVNRLFALNLNIKLFYLTHREDLSGATTPGKKGPGCNGNEGLLHIPRNITGKSPSDCFVSYPLDLLLCSPSRME